MTTLQQALFQASEKIDRTEAKLLMCHLLQVGRTYLITHDREELSELTYQKYLALVLRRQQGEPVPYIVGFQEFYSRRFAVTPDTLIPRPDTESLVETVLQYAHTFPKHGKILDLGTGSGCIAITLALELPQWQIHATDFNLNTLQIAQHNAQTLNATVSFSQGSWFQALHKDKHFDIIVSNPPYIHPADEHLKNLRFEPVDALTDHHDGLSDLREIIQEAPNHLNANGWLFLEHGYDQGQAVRQLFDLDLWHHIQTIKDLGDNDRVTLAQLHLSHT